MDNQEQAGGPDTAQRSSIDELRKDLSASVAWSFQALLAASAFCAVTAASHEDWELLAGALPSGAAGDVEVPIVGLKVVFLFFFVVGPIVLIAMQVYLQIQARALLHLPGAEHSNGLLSNHDQRWPMSLLGFASYAVVPAVTAFLLWKIWPRRFTDDPLVFGAIAVNPMIVIVALTFIAACLVSVRGAVLDLRCLRTKQDAEGRPWRPDRFSSSVAALMMVGLFVALGVALPERHLEMRKAPLERADLRYYDMRHADLREARLSGASMGGAMLVDALLAGASLDAADLRGAQLSRADLSNARLNGADLTGAWLVSARLSRVEAEGARFQYAWMPGASFEPLPRTPVDRIASPSEADRLYAQAGLITAANFDQAKLCGARITPGHWTSGVSIGLAEVSVGPPFYDPAAMTDGRQMPAGFHAEPLPDARPEAVAGFLSNKLASCLTALNICEVHGVPQTCSGAP